MIGTGLSLGSVEDLGHETANVLLRPVRFREAVASSRT